MLGLLLAGWDSSKQDDGEVLAQQYCQSCHLLPEPAHLDKATWISKVFPMMRRFMSMDATEITDDMPHAMKNFFPDHPSMTEDEWFEVAQWYVDNAPDKLDAIPIPTIHEQTVFTASGIDGSSSPPMTTLVVFDSLTQRMIIGDGTKNRLIVVDQDSKDTSFVALNGPPSSLLIENGVWFVTDMGDLFPHDSAIGSLTRIEWNKNDHSITRPLDPLLRPTDVKLIDMNGDAVKDYLICEYGDNVGRFGWYDGVALADGSHSYNVLIPRPGAIRSHIADINSDGRPDIVVQLAQAREGVFAFMNEGDSFSDIVELATFPPSYGSSSLTLFDWNEDGFLDLIVTAGDNGDYDNPPFKPYHGTRVLVNTGNLNFIEDLFIPMDGAYAARCLDFDLDGKLDLFTYSYFPNMDHGNAAMIQFHSDVKGLDIVSTINVATTGRWLVSDFSDIDSDGDIDILLGNVSMGPGVIPDSLSSAWFSGVRAALVLENQSR